MSTFMSGLFTFLHLTLMLRESPITEYVPGKVTHSDPIVFCHQVKRVDFLAARFQPLGQLCLSAPKIGDNRRVFSLSDALHNQV